MFVRNSEGSVAVLVSILAPVLLFFAIYGIDIGIAYTAKNQLQSAVDSAALASASDVNNANSISQNLVKANFVNPQYIKSVITRVNSDDSVTVNGTAVIPSITPSSERTITASATAKISNDDFFLSIAVDNSNTSPADANQLSDVKDELIAAMINIFGSNNTLKNSRISIIPFNSGVNISVGLTDHWLNPDYKVDYHANNSTYQYYLSNRSVNFPYVENLEDFTDTPPTASNKQTQFIPAKCISSAFEKTYTPISPAYSAAGYNSTKCDNESHVYTTLTESEILEYSQPGFKKKNGGTTERMWAVGPSLPDTLVPIMVADNRYAELTNRIREMRAHGNRALNVGLQWAWYAVSDRWRSAWNARNNWIPGKFPTLPLPKKILIISYGDNNRFTGEDLHPLFAEFEPVTGSNISYPNWDISKTGGRLPFGYENIHKTTPFNKSNFNRGCENMQNIWAADTMQLIAGIPRNGNATICFKDLSGTYPSIDENAALLKICDAIKQKNIIIYTISYKKDNTYLAQCASPNGYTLAHSKKDLREAIENTIKSSGNIHLIR